MRRFLDVHLDFFSELGARLCRGELLYINGPWNKIMLARIVHALLVRLHRGAWMVVPARRREPWYTLLRKQPRAQLVRRWPAGTPHLFAPAARAYKPSPHDKGPRWDVELWWFAPAQ